MKKFKKAILAISTLSLASMATSNIASAYIKNLATWGTKSNSLNYYVDTQR